MGCSACSHHRGVPPDGDRAQAGPGPFARSVGGCALECLSLLPSAQLHRGLSPGNVYLPRGLVRGHSCPADGGGMGYGGGRRSPCRVCDGRIRGPFTRISCCGPRACTPCRRSFGRTFAVACPGCRARDPSPECSSRSRSARKLVSGRNRLRSLAGIAARGCALTRLCSCTSGSPHKALSILDTFKARCVPSCSLVLGREPALGESVSRFSGSYPMPLMKRFASGSASAKRAGCSPAHGFDCGRRCPLRFLSCGGP